MTLPALKRLLAEATEAAEQVPLLHAQYMRGKVNQDALTVAVLRLESSKAALSATVANHAPRLIADAELLEEAMTALRSLLEFPVTGPACQEHDGPAVPGCAACEAQSDYQRRWHETEAKALDLVRRYEVGEEL